MISIVESSFLRPPKHAVPTEDDLSAYNLTKQEFDDWKSANPDSRYRKFEKTFMDPRFQAFMATYSAINGNYISAANSFRRSLPEEVDKRNQYYLQKDLAAARKYYDLNSAAAKNQKIK